MPVPLRGIRVGVALRLRFVLAFLAAILCATAIVQASPALASRITGWRSARTSSTDTIPVFGPKRFEATGSRAAYYVERFSAAANPGTRYLLRVQSGETNGTGRPTRGGVLVNGATVISAEEIARGGAFLKPVDLQGQNTLEVTLEGAAGAGITVWVLQVPDPTFTVLPPRRFIRGTGEPFVERVRFRMVPSAGPPFLLHVANGNADGTRRVASATLWVNGTAAVGASEFTQQVAGLVRPVALAEDNSVDVEVRSQPGSFVTVWLTATDTAAPVLEILAPAPALVSKLATVDVSGRVQDATVTQVSVNGVVAARSDDGFTANVPLAVEGPNTLRIRAIDAAGNRTDSVRTVIRDTEAPRIALLSPAEGAAGRDSMVHVVGTVQDRTAVTANVNGVPLTLTAAGAFVADVPAAEGVTFLTITGTDAAGNSSTLVRQVTRDTHPPRLAISAPTDGFTTTHGTVEVRGSALDETPVLVGLNGSMVPVRSDGGFVGAVPLLVEGLNPIRIVAVDAAGNEAAATVFVRRDSTPPVITVTSPAEGASTTAAQVVVTGKVADASSVTLKVNGVDAPLSASGLFSTQVNLVPGRNSIQLVAADAVGNTSAASRSVTRTADNLQLPPDPATVAPRLDGTVPTTVGKATAFLYTGEHPIQTGVAPGTILSVRAAVVRGKLLTRDGEPLSGATVTVTGHPEYGRTLSRADGMYDLAVNGGGPLELRYEKTGYLPAQRQVTVAWQDYASAPEVRLVALDPAVTVVDVSGAASVPQVARGQVQTDQSGPRQATVFIPAGATASLEMPDGSQRPVTSLSVRATEYTVGPNGRAAMPAPLPPTSAYTYAVELSADEATAAGARHVRFSRPVSFYVENFLRLPVGIPVPVATYEAQQRAWVPMPDGRIIQILGRAGGLAQVDITGDAQPDDPGVLASIGLDAAEQRTLAETYPDGASLWRTRSDHFSPHDLNFPITSSGTAPPPGGGRRKPLWGDEDCPGTTGGSIIECQTQILGERIGVAGTGLSLNYRSSRVPGQLSNRTITVALTSDTILSLLKLVKVEVDVSGQHAEQTFAPDRHLSFTYTWDGLDAYGRAVVGPQKVHVRRTYLYGATYAMPVNSYTRVPGDVARSFGLPCSPPDNTGVATCGIEIGADGDRSRAEYVEVDTWDPEITESRIGGWDARAQALGGWTLSAHHAYDPVAHTLYLGTGEQRSAVGDERRSITTIAGTGTSGYAGDGGRAVDAQLRWPGPMALAPDGTLYVSGWEDANVRRITPDGRIELFAGSTQRCADVTGAACGDGGSALQARFIYIEDLAFGPDGSLYVGDAGEHRVRRISPDGIVSTVAGGGGSVPSGDEGLATQAGLGYFWGIDVDREGSVYIAEGERNYPPRIRKVTPDGVIHAIAGGATGPGNGRDGNGSYWLAAPCNAEGVLATRACLDGIGKVRVGPDGDVYVLYHNTVRKITRSGAMYLVAGSPYTCYSRGDGGRGVDASLCASDMRVGPDGSVYVDDVGRNTIRRVTPDGLIHAVAGSANGFGFNGDLGFANQAGLNCYCRVIVHPSGDLIVADMFNNRIRRIGPYLPGFNENEIQIASGSGEIFHFDQTGRHLRTVDASSGRVLLRFEYDEAGRLSRVLDSHDRALTVERTSDGAPLALVSASGKRTELAVGADGYLNRATGPTGASVSMTYGGQGLLSTFTDARREVHRFSYAAGLLIRDEDPAGGYKTLGGFEIVGKCWIPTSVSDPGCQRDRGVDVRTAMGRTMRYLTVTDTLTRKMVTGPDGLTSTTTVYPDGHIESVAPDGTRTTATAAADPRFGASFSLLKQLTVRTPSGTTSTVATSRRVVLADPANPLSLIRQTDSLVVNGKATTTISDLAARTVTVVTPQGRRATVLNDSLWRPRQQQIPGSLPVDYAYDGLGRLSTVTRGDRVWRYAYDASGRLESTTDPLGHTTGFGYDSQGRLETQTATDGRVVRFGYDETGAVTSVTPSQRSAYRVSYGTGGLVDSTSEPSGTPGGGTTTYGYNLDHQVTDIAGPDGSHVRLAYDGAGRLDTLWLPAGPESFTYDPVTGHLARTTAPDGNSLSYSYDGVQLTGVSFSGQVSGAVGYRYDNNAHITSLLVNGQPVAFQYDGDGLLTRAGALSLTRNAVTGRLDATAVAGVASSRSYDEYGSLRRETFSVAGEAIFARSYDRDLIGRVRSATEVQGERTVAYAFAYDSITGALTEVKRDGVAVATYEYDAFGNRKAVASSDGLLTGTYDTEDRLIQFGGATYGYSAAGELTEKVVGSDTTRYGYRSGQLTSVSLPSGARIEYLLDPTGRRIGKRVDGEKVQAFLYAGAVSPIAELDGNDQVVTRFVYATHGNVPDYLVRDGQTYRVITDQLGSVRMVVNAATGETAQQIEYDAFGQVTADSNPGFQPFGFAGGLYDSQTQLTHFGARDYDARTGRWMSKDPLRLGGGSANLYQYALHDPVNLKDASGNCPLCVAMFLGGGIDLIKELWHNDGRLECVNWHSVARSAMLGGIFGAAGEALGAFVGGLLGEEAALASEGLEAAGIDIGAEVGAVTGDGGSAVADATTMHFTPVETPYGPAHQTFSEDALALHDEVADGAEIYRQGKFGIQQTTDAQFWANENPLTTRGFADKYGTAGTDVNDWVMQGTVRQGEGFVTRAAPAVGGNMGGGLEVVTHPGSVWIGWFHMP